jgi:hypothetical protein
MRAILVHLVFVHNVIDVFFRCKTVLFVAAAVDPCAANHGALDAY